MTDQDRELQAQLIAPTIVPTDPRVAELEKRLLAMQEQHTATKADAFVASQLASLRILPAAAAHLRTAYVALASFDTAAPLAALESFCATLPAHSLTAELVPDGSVILGNHTGATATAEETHAKDRDAYLAKVEGTSNQKEKTNAR